MQTIQELGQVVADRRRELRMKQADVAERAGVSAETLSRFERGRGAEFGTRKLLAVLAVLDAELDVIVAVRSGNLDELREERAGKASRSPVARRP